VKQESRKNLLSRIPNEKRQKMMKVLLKNPVMKTVKKMLKLDKRAPFDIKFKMRNEDILV
jgi:hypothetical protein